MSQGIDTEVVTESSNHITIDIDISSDKDILKLLRQSDSQIFSGYSTHNGLCDSHNIKSVNNVIDSLIPYIRKRESADEPHDTIVLFSGAGTSGRLSFFSARTFNEISDIHQSNFKFGYLMSGGDQALLKAQEKAEDDVNISIEDLKNAIKRMPHLKNVIYIGITCGMSAPYVGSQIQWILENEKESDLTFTTILIGFNPIEASRKAKIENYDKTMYDIIKSLNNSVGDNRHFILNPVIGPESITGSSRMKGGTTTKILIETIFGKLYADAFKLPSLDRQRKDLSVTNIFSAYEEAYRYTYYNIDDISEIIRLAGDSLKNGKRISYVACETISLLGLIDASECPPTYGASFNDFRGFIVGGWETMKNMDGDISYFGDDYKISDDYFFNNYMSQLGNDDLIIYLYSNLYSHEQQVEVLDKIKKKYREVKLVIISWKRENDEYPDFSKHINPNDLVTHISIPIYNLIEGASSFLELSVKLVLNAISTGAHIKKGKVWKNRMIDLSLSNNKLFNRGIDLVAKLMNISKEESENNILKVIYHGINDDMESIKKYPVSDHISNAMIKKSVIPTSLLLSSGQFSSVDDAIMAVKKEPILRNAISLAIEKKRNNV